MKDNKLIAEFMGLPTEVFKPSGITNHYHREYNSGTWYEEHELSYNVSWDWLIPVMAKLVKDFGSGWTFEEGYDLNTTYHAVVEFIKQENR